MLRLHFGQVGAAEIHLQDNKVSLSQGVYTLSVAESGQVERAQPLSRHTCVIVDVCLCSRSNLEGAGGCSLFDVINSLCSLLAARREPVNILPHAPLFIFHVLVTASVLWAHPIPSSLAVITVAYDVNDNPRFYFIVAQLKEKKKMTKFKLKVLKMSKVSFIPLCKVSFEKKHPTMSRGSKLSKLLQKRLKERGKSAPKCGQNANNHYTNSVDLDCESSSSANISVKPLNKAREKQTFTSSWCQMKACFPAPRASN